MDRTALESYIERYGHDSGKSIPLFRHGGTSYPINWNICFPKNLMFRLAGALSRGTGPGCRLWSRRPFRVNFPGARSGGRAEGSPPGVPTGLAARRKVRAPQGRMPGNARAPRGDGKCSREQTADGPGNGAQARVKGCGKSAPGAWQQASHGKPHPEQGQIGDCGAACPASVPGRPLEARSDPGPRQMIPSADGRSTELGL